MAHRKSTKIGSAEGEAPNGAEFVIVKQESEVTKYSTRRCTRYVCMDVRQIKRRNTLSAAIVKRTGEEDFVEESAAAKGQMIVAGLEVGEYVLEWKPKRLKMLEMIADQTTTLFTIISGSQTPVAKHGKNDTTK